MEMETKAAWSPSLARSIRLLCVFTHIDEWKAGNRIFIFIFFFLLCVKAEELS